MVTATQNAVDRLRAEQERGVVLDDGYGPDERYAVYAQRDGKLHRLATAPDPAGVGTALVHLHEDAKEVGRRLSDEGVIGVRDIENGEWVVLPFPRGGNP